MATPRYTYRIGEEMLADVDALVVQLAPLATRTRILKLALERGLAALHAELSPAPENVEDPLIAPAE
jgi:hypothetical protein